MVRYSDSIMKHQGGSSVKKLGVLSPSQIITETCQLGRVYVPRSLVQYLKLDSIW